MAPTDSIYAALEAVSIDAREQGHPVTLHRAAADKYVARCTQCGHEVPVLSTARGWIHPTPAECPERRQELRAAA